MALMMHTVPSSRLACFRPTACSWTRTPQHRFEHSALLSRQHFKSRPRQKIDRHAACMAKASDAENLANKYSPGQLQESARLAKSKASSQSGTALFVLIMANIALYAADHLMAQGWVRGLYLNHLRPKWWQFLTCAFCHGSWQHLSSNLFGLYVFGRLVEEEGSGPGLWMTYIVTAVGASIASYFALPKAAMSLGASGAVFGLYAVSVLLKFASGFSFRKTVEAVILGQFVISQIQQELVTQSAIMRSGAMVGASGISHVAHLAGAAAGVLLIVLLSRLPDGEEAT